MNIEPQSGVSARGLFGAPAGQGLTLRNVIRRKRAALANRFAERLAEHGDVKRASHEIGISLARGRGLFAYICEHLGPQAS